MAFSEGESLKIDTVSQRLNAIKKYEIWHKL